jgi:lysophospholipase L1-like esterase
MNPIRETSRFLALGDSYTIGESVDTVNRWPELLAAELHIHGCAIEQPLIIARTGWTTDELDAAITQTNPVGPFALVTLLIGVNNQYRGRSAEEYRGEFRRLLLRAIDFAGGVSSRVIVISIPDWGVTPFAGGRDRVRIASEIDAFNAISKEEAGLHGTRYVDITPLSRKASAEQNLIAADGLHPSGVMYAGWVTCILPEALAALRQTP